MFFERWFNDIKEVLNLLLKRTKTKFRFEKEITLRDKLYGAFLVGFSLWPAVIIVKSSKLPQVDKMAQFFAAPMHTVIVGGFMIVVIMIGLKLNKLKVKAVPAIHLTLRLMSVYPFLGFLKFSAYGNSFILMAYSLLVPLGVIKTFKIYPRNAFLFYSIFYLVLAFIQLKTTIR